MGSIQLVRLLRASTLLLCLELHLLGANASVLKATRHYEEIRRNATDVTRVQSVDVVHINTAGSPPSTIPFVHLAYVMPFSALVPERSSRRSGIYQAMAAVFLAVEHLNTGNGTIVKEIEGLSERCDLKFTVEAFDTALSKFEAVDQIIDIVSRDAGRERLPAAFIGAARSAVSIPTSIVTGLRGFPQISGRSTSAQLDDRLQYPLFGRTTPSDAGIAIPAILFYRHELGVKHLAVVHVNDAYGNSYAWGLQKAAAEYAPDMTVEIFDFPFDVTPEIVERTIASVKKTGFRYIFGIIFSTTHYPSFMTEAYHQGIAGDGKHHWMFSDGVSLREFGQTYEIGSPLHLATRGATRISTVAGASIQFQQRLDELNNEVDLEWIKLMHPKYPNEPDYEPEQIENGAEFFFKAAELVEVGFSYDAAIALGLAACEGTKNDGSFFDGHTHYSAFKNTTFDGTTGHNLYDPETGTRIPSSARFMIANAVEDDILGTESVRMNSLDAVVFQDEKWTYVEELIFNDRSNVPPSELPALKTGNNYIGSVLRWIGISMSGVILCLSLWWSVWTSTNRNAKVIRASQPVFLHLVTGGCSLMGSSIIFLSLDDEVVSTEFCTVSCMAVPWLVGFGWIVTFSALFTKTYRVNQIFHNPTSKRMKVTVRDVLKPMAVLMAVAVTILTTWTINSPPIWVRKVTGIDIFDRVTSTRGYCDYARAVPYASILAIILLGVLAYAIYQAYAARHVSTQFSESEYIFLVMCAIMLVCFLGIPTLIIARDDTRARFFTAAGLIFLICVAILLLIFLPKVLALRDECRKSSLEFLARSQRNFQLSTGIQVSGFLADPTFATLNNHADFKSEAASITDLDAEDGIKVLHYPQEIEALKKRVDNQDKTIHTLRTKLEVRTANFAIGLKDSDETEPLSLRKSLIRFQSDLIAEGSDCESEIVFSRSRSEKDQEDTASVKI